MALPEKLINGVFPDTGILAGFRLGTPAKDLEGKLPSWFEKPLPDRTGDTYGNFRTSEDEDEGFTVFVNVSLSVGRVSSVQVSFDLPDGEDLESAFRELADHFDEKFGVGSMTTKSGKSGKKFHGEWILDKEPVASRLRVDSAPYYMGPEVGGYLLRTEIYLELADDAQLEAEPSSDLVDTAALAKLVASKSWPEARCKETFDRFFSADDAWAATSKDEQVAKNVAAIYAAFSAENPDVRETLRNFLGLADWSNTRLDTEDHAAKRLHYCTWGICHFSWNNSVVPGKNIGTWSHLNVRDLARFVALLTKKPDDRAGWAWKVIEGLEYGDAPAYAEVAAALVEARKHVDASQFHLVFDSTPDLDRRAFELITSGLSIDDRLRAAMKMDYRLSAVTAATAWLSLEKKIPIPAQVVPPTAKSDDHKKTAAAWSAFLSVVKAHSPALWQDAFAAAMDALKFAEPAADAVADMQADERETIAKSGTFWNGYRAGVFVVTRSGKNGKGGRLTTKRYPDEKAASKDFAKKVGAARKK